ncbi:MAG TPA: signal peptidase I [Candidatus Butyricicoccus stercorigallinarum]|nr:signal peptidase I [Candidatus Butyricicoccus stercorigallinarum]
MRKQNKNTAEEGAKGRFHSELFDWGEALLISLSVVILVFVFGVRIIGVQGSSMEPTLQDANQLLVSNLFYTPEKGDIVILTKDSFMESPIVKRVIATEGDTIDIDFETGAVTVNGEQLEETYIAEPTTTFYDVTFPQTVPEDCIFVMGDNRNHSTDSRYGALGMVDTRYIIGKVLMRIYPLNEIGTVS